MPIEPYDVKELKLRSISEVMRDLPPDYKLKEYLPMAENALLALRVVDDFKTYEERFSSSIGGDYASKLLQTRWEETIEVEKAVKDGRIPKNRKKQTVAYWGIPPVIPMLTSLSGMSAKMIYGPSADISYCAINDITGEIEMIFNAHAEDGAAVDYWFVLPGDEILERRHMRLGYKLKEIPNKVKGIGEASSRVREILIDMRNEMRPEWVKSSYHISLVYMTGLGTAAAISNWNATASIWDGVNAKRVYGMDDLLFAYEPWPPILNMLFALPRGDWCIKITQMLTDNRLFLNYIEKDSLEYMKKHEPEGYEQFLKIHSYKYHKGIVLPSQTVNCKIPQYDKAKKEWTQKEFIYPKGPRIHYEELGLSFEEVISGVLFDITHKTQLDKVTRDDIISIGHGLKTKYLKPPAKRKKVKKVKKIKKIRKIIKK
ncbi:MAG: hypothetical protein ACTSO9_06580 [Candidatus Helarchaeota archaeon]